MEADRVWVCVEDPEADRGNETELENQKEAFIGLVAGVENENQGN